MSNRDEAGRGEATRATREANEALAATLAWEDTRDFEEAARGLIAPLPDEGRVRGADGGLVWDLSRFAFLHEHEESPDTVNPSLWRQTRLDRPGRALRGRAGALPGAHPRSLEHHVRRGRGRDRRIRPADLDRDGGRGAGALLPAPAAKAGRRGRVLAQPRRPLRRRARDRRRGRRGGREGQDRRPRRVPRGRGGGERARGQRDEPARELHVRQPAARRPARPGRSGAGHVDLVGRDRADRRRRTSCRRPASG